VEICSQVLKQPSPEDLRVVASSLTPICQVDRRLASLAEHANSLYGPSWQRRGSAPGGFAPANRGGELASEPAPPPQYYTQRAVPDAAIACAPPGRWVMENAEPRDVAPRRQAPPRPGSVDGYSSAAGGSADERPPLVRRSSPLAEAATPLGAANTGPATDKRPAVRGGLLAQGGAPLAAPSDGRRGVASSAASVSSVGRPDGVARIDMECAETPESDSDESSWAEFEPESPNKVPSHDATSPRNWPLTPDEAGRLEEQRATADPRPVVPHSMVDPRRALAAYQGGGVGEDLQPSARSSSTESDVLDRNSDDWPTGPTSSSVAPAEEAPPPAAPAPAVSAARKEAVGQALAEPWPQDTAVRADGAPVAESRQVDTAVPAEERPRVSVRARIESMNSGQDRPPSEAEAREDRPQPAQPAQPDRAEPSGKQKRKDRHRRRKDDGPEAEAPETRDPARRRSKGSKAWKLSLGLVSGLMHVKSADASIVVAYAGEYCCDIPKRRRIRMHKEAGDWQLEKSAVTVHDGECKLFVITDNKNEVLAESPILTGMDLRRERDVPLAVQGQRVGTITLLAQNTRSSGTKESGAVESH